MNRKRPITVGQIRIASWVEAHNAVVRKLNEGVLISDEALEKGPGSGADLGSAIGD